VNKDYVKNDNVTVSFIVRLLITAVEHSGSRHVVSVKVVVSCIPMWVLCCN